MKTMKENEKEQRQAQLCKACDKLWNNKTPWDYFLEIPDEQPAEDLEIIVEPETKFKKSVKNNENSRSK